MNILFQWICDTILVLGTFTEYPYKGVGRILLILQTH